MTDSITPAAGLDAIEPAAGLGAIAPTGQDYDLNTLSAGSATAEIRGSNFNALAETALNSALKEIGNTNAVTASRDGLTGAAPNSVDEAKDGVLSDVARPGTEAANEENPQDTLQAVEDRAKNLYGEMMVHHIAWGVAQRMQKDMSQLLRGS